jgi:hypothetical protein
MIVSKLKQTGSQDRRRHQWSAAEYLIADAPNCVFPLHVLARASAGSMQGGGTGEAK